MDKFEYKVRAEEIKSLIAKGDYAQAAEIADTIDWRRVKSVMMLCTISDLYKINRRYEDARDMLLLAYDRHPGGRTICYSLCELSIKMEEFVEAVEYYKEFVQIAPKDTGRYILQYKLYEAQDVSLEERIAVLEELKKRDYREKWAYELAYLYHRVGLSTRCVEECDELILWFGNGKYVIKALELKMLHQPLTPQQQQKYEYRFEPRYDQVEAVKKESEGRQQAAFEGKQAYQEAAFEGKKVCQEAGHATQAEADLRGQAQKEAWDQDRKGQAEAETRKAADEYDIQVKTVDVSQYNTINLQRELAEGLKEVLGEEVPTIADPVTGDFGVSGFDRDTESFDSLQIEEVDEETLEPEMQETEVFFGETGELGGVDEAADLAVSEDVENIEVADDVTIYERPKRARNLFEDALSMEPDGQISLVMPKMPEEDKQITGQLSIEDVMKEWERLKKEAELDQDIPDEVEEIVEIEDEPEYVDGECVDDEEYVGEDEYAGDEYSYEEYAVNEGYEEECEVELGESEVSGMPEENELETTESEANEPASDVPVAEEPTTDAPVADALQSDQAPAEEMIVSEKPRIRNLSKEEKALFGSFIQNRSARYKLIAMLDDISMASYTGNVIITGDEGVDTLNLAKNVVRDVQMTDSNFSGKTAKISGQALNQKDVTAIIDQLQNGALIIQKASDIDDKTATAMYKKLQRESQGIIVIMEDTKKNMNKFLERNEMLQECFTARMDMEALSNETLVAFGKKYAREREYSIDDLGVLALHTRIEELQTIDHAVTIMEVKEIVDEAIENANRKNIKHFFDILMAKRYDDEDMIIIRENDFI